jgi:predicted AAA+ superfamily ATPase
MNKTELKNIIVAQKELVRGIDYIERDFVGSAKDWQSDPFIRIFAGIRRCGKSTLLEHIRQQNEEKNYTLNFDDNRLTNFSSDDFERLYESFHEMYPPENTWYFDEIQIVEGWEVFVRRLHNEGQKVYITGSNARMLSHELGTHLTGRHIQTELFPFSFSEFLRFNKIQLSKNDFYSPTKSTALKKLFKDYVLQGGFPEFLQTKNQEYLKSLYENIIYRDVVARYNIRNTKTLIEMLHFLISNISKETSYNALKNIFGIANANTVKEYISYFENAYLLFSINKFDYSLKKQLANAKKVYCIDTGLANMVSFSFSENYGRQLENIVFLELRKRSKEIYYHKNKYECDFITQKNQKVSDAIQVCQSLENDSTRKREINGLLEAMRDYQLHSGLIITEYEEETILENGMTIRILPAWKWLLAYTGEVE